MTRQPVHSTAWPDGLASFRLPAWRSRPIRAVLGVVGLLVALAGMIVWSLETEYGSGTNFMAADGEHTVVYAVDEQRETGTRVFAGTGAEVMEYIETHRSTELNFTVPVLLLSVGAAMVLFGAWPHKRSPVQLPRRSC